MSQTKVQLIAPIGVVTASTLETTGVLTATTFVGDIAGTVTGITSTTDNLNLGIVTATSFAGDFTGIGSGLTGTPNVVAGVVTATKFIGNTPGLVSGVADGTNINAGIITATSFVGNLTGNAAGLSTTTANLNLGIVTATSFAGNFTGVASGITGTPNIVVGIMTGTLNGDGSSLTGIAATNWIANNVPGSIFSINVTASGSSNYTLSGTDRSGSVSGSDPTVTVEIGDTLNFVVDASGHPFYIRVSDGGANVSTPAATNQGSQSGTVSWTPNTAGTYYYQCGNHAGMIGTITVTATTTIDLSLGNVVKFTQSANTTVSFANTGTSNIVSFIRVDDNSGTDRTITWPSSIKWDGGIAPTLVNNTRSSDGQVFTLLTRDEGVTWYGWEIVNADPQTFTAWAWGNNQGGSLGQNDTNRRSSPVQIGSENTWSSLSGGVYSKGHTYGIKNDNTLWSWGYNDKGQLGLNSTTYYSSPVQVPGTTWSKSGQGFKFAAAVRTDGTMWMMGSGTLGQLAQNNETEYSSPVQIYGGGTTWSTEFVTSYAQSHAIKTDGTLWCWGQNPFDVLGVNSPVSILSSPIQIPGSWSKVARNYFYSNGAIKSGNTLWMWGRNSSGQLGLNNKTQYKSPVQVPGTTWANVSCDQNRTLATKTDGTLWGWGEMNHGCLGLNQESVTISSPVQVPGTTWHLENFFISDSLVAAMKTDGTLWTWGYNSPGMLGQNSRTSRSSPTQVPGTWSDIYQGNSGMKALQKAG